MVEETNEAAELSGLELPEGGKARRILQGAAGAIPFVAAMQGKKEHRLDLCA